MSSADSSSIKVILVALFANLGIAACKFMGAFYTGSASLLAEAIHSLADCTNQIFLLIGTQKAKKQPDDDYPLGYGRESFFWSFMVAILLFSMGGLFAIYEGYHKLSQSDSDLKYPSVGLSILVLSMLLEGGSFLACLKEVKKQNPYPNLWIWFRKSTASDLVVIFMEDFAALVGLAIATLFLLIAMMTKNPMWDGVGSIFIGGLLIVVSFLLAREVKSLIVGEKSSKDYRQEIQNFFTQENSEVKILTIISLATGSNEVMIAMKITAGSLQKSSDLIDSINRVEIVTKKRFPEIKWLFIEPDNKE